MNDQTNSEVDRLVSKMLDGQLSHAERSKLNEWLARSPDAVKRYQHLLDNHEALCSIYPGDVYGESLGDSVEDQDHQQTVDSEFPAKLRAKLQATQHPSLMRSVMLLATAAALLIGVGLAGYMVGSDQDSRTVQKTVEGEGIASISLANEQTIPGHAMLRRSLGLIWASDASTFRDGDVLPGGQLQIASGIAEIDFFCGATLTVEGPASLDIQSDWSVKVDSGRLRAIVPPAARGFIVQTSSSEIIDLGTEFALNVGADNARVEVIDGEVKLRGGKHDGLHLTTGQARWLGEEGASQGNATLRDASGEHAFVSSSADVGRRREDAQATYFARWQQHSLKRQNDDRLIAYYPIANMKSERAIENASATGSIRDASLVGPVQRSFGRFGQSSTGLEFDRVGARARTRIDGQFSALTFSTWVRIDSLDHVYNALFMSDGYETGELHWQIRNDGSMMFSVMVDDTKDIKRFSERDNGVVRTAGLARVYYTDPFWDASQSGRWFNLVAVYDPGSRRVAQYVNGKQVSNEIIEDKFFIDRLKIGPAEIGNWGQPFRETPWFAVRNLNGTIDELSIYSTALESDEVAELYEQGKPLGY